MKRYGKVGVVVTIALVLAMLPTLAFASGKPPKAEAIAFAYADVGPIEILTTGLKEEGQTIDVTFIVPFNSFAVGYGEGKTGWSSFSMAYAEAYAYADGLAWGSVTKPDGSTVFWFNTGIVSNQDFDFDFDAGFKFPQKASALAFASYNEVMVITTQIKLDQIGDWVAYLGADTIAEAFASAGYKMCKCGCCWGDKDCAWASDYDLAELWKIFHVWEPPQLPSIKLWTHTDGYAMEYYRVTNLIDPWAVKSLSQGLIEYVVPYDESLAGMGWWTNTQRGVYFLQPWDPANGHSAELFGIVAYLSKVTGAEIHLWPTGDTVWTDGTIIFAPKEVAEMIQATYEALGRNPGEEELGVVMQTLLYLPRESYSVYLSTIS
jgi:hypothetical protein